MGEVYRARDGRLDRDVAIKVLPEAFRTNPEARARFEREAKAVAAMSHPNIMGIHDFGEDDGVVYAVIELLDGETLRDALAAGPLPSRKAVDYARMAARGLGAAHDNEIVHRDLKPENLFLTRGGSLKILDFGLARSTADAPASLPENTPTFTHLTGAGAVLGTVNYMSPEQARGEPVGSSSDIFSLGTVLYEMLRGKRPFEEDTVPETMTAILREDPPPFPDGETVTPLAVQRIVQRCLEKQPEQRFHSAHDLAFALETSSGSTMETQALVTEPRRARRSLPMWLIPVILVLGLLVGAWLKGTSAPSGLPSPVKIEQLTFTGTGAHPAASRDGRTIAFTARRAGSSGLWIKQLQGGREARLTDGNDSFVRFSPDGTSILFSRLTADGPSIFRIPAVGGDPRKMIDLASEADWSPDSKSIVFVRNSGGSDEIGICNADGADERILATFDGLALGSPRWSPDGRHIAVVSSSQNNVTPLNINLVDVKTGEVTSLPPERPSLTGLAWSGDGEHLVFGWSDDLLAGSSTTAVKMSSLNVTTGETVDLFWANRLLLNQFGSRLDIVDDGRIVFGTIGNRQGLTQLPLQPGIELPSLTLTDGNSVDRQPVYSPDGTKILFSSNRGGNLDLWIFDAASESLTQLTDDTANDWDPAFMPDGSRIIWSSDRSGNLEIWIASLDGGGARQVTRDGVDAENPTASSDGEWIIYSTSNPKHVGLWKIRQDGSDATRLLAKSIYTPQISPDGRYVLFPSQMDSTSTHLYVLEIETLEVTQLTEGLETGVSRTMVSVGRPRWLDGGRSFVYVARSGPVYGLITQEFDEGRDTTSTSRLLLPLTTDFSIESFGISPDSRRVTISRFYSRGEVQMAEGVPYVKRPRFTTQTN